jgi:hypothetical protein
MAWLMLVVTSLGAAPMGTGHSHGPAVDAVTATASEPSHHGLAHHDPTHASSHECCGQQAGDPGAATGHACGCIGMCASAVLPAPAGVVMDSWVSTDYAQPARLNAPSTLTSPPLRPPLA